MSDPARPDAAAPRPPLARPAFAHASEAELARILDFYQVRWAYEPDTFPIGWNLDGEVVESFSPDFYLPDLELYVELTTLKQKLVRKKNRKLRRLHELYPDVRIKLFYARDFRMLLLKFGRLALVDELTGSTGQVPSPHASEVELASPVAGGAAAADATADEALRVRPAVAATVAGRAAEDQAVAIGAGADPAVETSSTPPPIRLAEMRGRRRGRRRRGRGGDRSGAGTPDTTAVTGLDPDDG